MVCLSCIASSRDSRVPSRVCLAAEGFGNRMCFLENISSRVSTGYGHFALAAHCRDGGDGLVAQWAFVVHQFTFV